MSHSTLETLALRHGISVEYVDGLSTTRHASPEALVAVLGALGAPVAGPADAADALAALDESEACVPRVAVVGPGRPGLQVGAEGRLRLSCAAPVFDHSTTFEGRVTPGAAVTLPSMPFGAHELRWELGDAEGELLLLVPPTIPSPRAGRSVGIFAPLYALRDEASPDLGDLGTLARLATRARVHGARFVGTLPLLATYLREGFDPSPYAPVSHRFWNELYVDLGALPEAAGRTLPREPLGEGPLVDHRAAYERRRSLLDEFAGQLSDSRRDSLEAHSAGRPELSAYAEFRAAREHPDDPAAQQTATLVHRYAQWAMDEQLLALGARERELGPGLYLDLPVGTRGDGFDVHQHPTFFARGVAVGAPPDALFAAGQCWAFPPLDPRRHRAAGYPLLRAALAHHMRVAGVLRVDHVAGLHRLFWVPDGMGAKEGVYVRQPAEELHALIAIEAHRHGCAVVGEDLGTVAPSVGEAMDRDGMLHTWVWQLEANADGPLGGPVPEHAVASLTTHDTPTFAGHFQGAELADHKDLGLLDDAAVADKLAARTALRAALADSFDLGDADDRLAARDALLAHCAEGPAQLLLVDLFELALEEQPHNVPGTYIERPNWRRRVPETVDSLLTTPAVRELLSRLVAAR